MLVKTYGAALIGIDATKVTIEVNLSQGINFFLVGLPDSAVKESQQRIKSAILNNDLRYPGKEITVNMAPADLRKEGASFDLAIGMGILAASDQVSSDRLADLMLIGELSLDGDVKSVRGILPIALSAKANGFKGIIVPAENAQEANMVDGLDIYSVSNIQNVIQILNGAPEIKPLTKEYFVEFRNHEEENAIDFSDVKGQLKQFLINCNTAY